MPIFKCKMCGGDLIFSEGSTVAVCEYCGTRQTLPKLPDDRRANLYDRANHFRRNNEFDKAMGIYEQILNEDNTDAETYWSLVLCRYGIEYVEDPITHKRLPTVHRAQYTSIFDDDNYKSALQYADSFQKTIYEEEANTINVIQKEILSISQEEDPFDVFICYKETDESGRRTQESVLANDLYYQLTQEGFKVFFSRITLEDKLGTSYEPYIFAALNSAKVMVVLSTKPEHFNAVWVKNEWSRYLALIKSGAKKTLIPAYRDMDPYDLPDEFSHLQALDMAKLGFMQDLIRGIRKIARDDEPPKPVYRETAVSGGSSNITALLRRAFIFLDDGDFGRADEYCEKVLDSEPENAHAYLGKLMAELQVRRQEDLEEQRESFETNTNFQKAVKFADAPLKATLMHCIEHISTRNETARLEGIYSRAKSAVDSATTAWDYESVAQIFESLKEYKDSAILAKDCRRKMEEVEKNIVLLKAKSSMTGDKVADYESALKLLESIAGWKDADEQLVLCQKRLDELKAIAAAEQLEKDKLGRFIDRNDQLESAISTYSHNSKEVSQILGLMEKDIPKREYMGAALLVLEKNSKKIMALDNGDVFRITVKEGHLFDMKGEPLQNLDLPVGSTDMGRMFWIGNETVKLEVYVYYRVNYDEYIQVGKSASTVFDVIPITIPSRLGKIEKIVVLPPKTVFRKPTISLSLFNPINGVFDEIQLP